jgi:PAS domain-containing protein
MPGLAPGLQQLSAHGRGGSVPLEGAANATEEILRALTEHTPVGIFVSNAAGKCEYVNRRWCMYQAKNAGREQVVVALAG